VKWARRLSIRWRITLGSVLVAAVLLAVATTGFRAQIASVLAHSDEELVYSETDPYVAAVQKHPDQLDQPAEDQYVAVIDATGKPRVDTLPESLSDRMSQLLGLRPGSHSVQYGNAPYLLRVEPVAVGTGTWHVIGAVSHRESENVLANVTNLLLVGALVLLLGFGVTSWLVTSAALTPVDRMRRRAAELTMGGSYEPLPVGHAKDELHELALTLNAFVDALRATAAREKQMVADASHELRTPLAALQAQLEVAQLTDGDVDSLRADLTAAEASVERLSRIATGLLELSEAESVRDDGPSTWQELGDEFVAASDRARLLGAAKHLDVRFDLDIDEVAVADERYPIRATQFARVIDNLIGNAVHAVTPGGSILARLEHGAGTLRLIVEDDGPGMPEDFIPVAFDRFTRPDAARGQAAGGAGLGLSIVHAIVTRAGGRVSLRNRTEGGLHALVAIPRDTVIVVNTIVGTATR
jgi:Signal transduction histidine kinase